MAFVANLCALETALAVLWFVVCRSVFAVAIERARRDGSVQLTS